MANTFVHKNIISKIENPDTSVRELDRIKKAIIDISDVPLKKLMSSKKVVSFSVGNTQLYMYRFSLKKRLIFAIIKDNKYLYDIISVDDTNQIRSKHKSSKKI